MTVRNALLVLVAVPLLGQLAQVPNLNGADPDGVDRTCRPCDDFYQFSIGTWHANHPIPASKSFWGKGAAAAEQNKLLLRSISENEAAKGGLVGNFYASCMDTTSMDAAGLTPIRSELERIGKIATAKQVGMELTSIFDSGLDAPIAIGSASHTQDPKRVVATLELAVLGLPNPEYYTRTDAKAKATLDRYEEFVRKLFRLANIPETDAGRILALETSFAHVMLTNARRRDPQTIRYASPEELREMVPDLDWKAHFAAVNLPFTGPIMITEPALLRELGRQLRETPLEVWKAYLTWWVLNSASKYLSEPFRKANSTFYDEYLAGIKEEPPRWQECVHLTDTLLGDALGKAYAERLSPAVKGQVMEIFVNVRSALAESLRGLDWLTPQTKKQALEKLATLRAQIAYPNRWHIYYGDPMQRGSFAANMLRARRYSNLDDAAQIGKPKDLDRWYMTVPTFNAYYDPSSNQVVVPAGRLIPPMFSLDADDAANYGAIGAVMGHEIGHGFDDQGSQYDSEGRLRDWWTPEDRKRFLQRAQCVVDQFDGYFVAEGLHHNGKFVLGESTGDLSGLRIAYAAYQKSLQGKPHPERRDGFTAEQRFFLAYAQFRGGSERIEQQRSMILADPHPTARYRVNGPLSNMPEFHAAFDCKRGDPMVRPTEKLCRIW